MTVVRTEVTLPSDDGDSHEWTYVFHMFQVASSNLYRLTIALKIIPRFILDGKLVHVPIHNNPSSSSVRLPRDLQR